MAVSHHSPKHQRGEGFRRVSETPPNLTAPAEPIRGQAGFTVSRMGPSNQTTPKKGMKKGQSMNAPSGRRRGYARPVD